MILRSKNLLITGGAGFIGSNYINYVLEKYSNLNVINLDLLTYAGNLENTKNFKIDKKYTFVEGDICDKELVTNIFHDFEIDGVINFAAESHVDNSINNPEIFIKTNINGVYNLLNIAYSIWMNQPFEVKEKFKNARFHQISTDEVYGSINQGSFDENSSYNPNSPYSSSKASADMLVRSFNKTFGMNVTTSISSNNYGPGQNSESFTKNYLFYKKQYKYTLYGNGSNIRNWIHVYDNCSAIDKIFNNGKSGSKYNIGSDFEISNLELIKLCFKILNKKSKIEFVDDRFGHDFRYSINSQKIKTELGWLPTKKIKQFLNEINLSL